MRPYSRLVADGLAAISGALAASGEARSRKRSKGNEVPRSVEQGHCDVDHYDCGGDLSTARSKAPRGHQSYLLLASSLTDRTRYEAATATLRLGLKEASERRELYIALAESLVREHDLPAAREVYEEALSEKALAEEALLGIARTYLAGPPPARSPRKAVQYALQAARQNRSSPEGHFLAGQIFEADGNFEQAEKHYQDALKISPASAEIASTAVEALRAPGCERTDGGQIRLRQFAT